ncbi:MAG: hypothetical protein ACT4OZ_14605 [Gemmatimonadota bacterium]
MPAILTDARERRTIRIGMAVAAVAMLFAWVVVPVGRRWTEREERIAVAADRVARLKAMQRDASTLTQLADSREAEAAVRPVRLARGRTTALAASSLQSMLQELALRTGVNLTTLDVAADSAPSGAIPASMAGVTDIYGLADLLTSLHHAPTLLEVSSLSVSSNSALQGDLLQIALSLRAPFVLEP